MICAEIVIITQFTSGHKLTYFRNLNQHNSLDPESKFVSKMRNYVREVEELNKSNVHIKNPGRVNEIIEGLIKGGCEKLQVVSDFDRTITKQHENGKIHMSSYGMFNCCPSISKEFREASDKLTKKYAPIEVDPTIPLEEKIKFMVEWWTLSEQNLKGLTITDQEISEVCALVHPSLRDGTRDFFEELYKADIPVIVFSAGLGDIVVGALKQCEVLFPNVEVISNFLKYDEKGTILGFKDTIIHVFNKNENAIRGTNFSNKIKDKNNVILLGDSLGDANMVEGVSHLDNVLKIGFVYERGEESLPSYMDTFDIVLYDDQTMKVPRTIFNLIQN